MNTPQKSPWFQGAPEIFQDYLIIGNDYENVFCLSKKYNLPNPSVYICTNSNSQKEIELHILYLDLKSLILEMVNQVFC